MSRTAAITHDFATFRDEARRLLADAVPPQEVQWINEAHGDLFAATSVASGETRSTSVTPSERAAARVPKQFVDVAQLAVCNRSDDICPLLYRVLWRLTHGEHDLLKIAIDDDVHQLLAMEKAVRRDLHKMTAFVRFRKIAGDTGDHFMAWHRPDHLIVRHVSPFFVDRFRSMHWTILTPEESMTWDGNALVFGDGVARDPFAGEDDVQSLWTTYYANIFNPARIKLKAMQKEMPKKHWATMPETALIPELLAAAPKRVETMIRQGRSVDTAAPLVPAERSLPVLRAAAESCRACPIGCNATQTVFGEGPADARVVFVGEQPGDEEDRAGRPFVGPAGRVLMEIMNEIGLHRSAVYVTNAVKHFKFEPRGKRRIHSKPSAREMVACRPWVEAELETIKPQVLVMLGNTAGHSLVGHHLRVTRDRGQWMTTKWCERTMFTFHPSAILRAPTPDLQREMREQLKADLKMVVEAMNAPAPSP